MTILVDDLGAVRAITLNRPEVRNAIDLPLRMELAEALEAVSSGRVALGRVARAGPRLRQNPAGS